MLFASDTVVGKHMSSEELTNSGDNGMQKGLIVFMLLVLWGPAALYLGYRFIKMFNSPDGERLRRTRAQGPFVPLSREDIAEDEARIHAARQQPQH